MAGFQSDWGSRVLEPYAKVSAINELLGGDKITINQTSFFRTLSGVGIQSVGGVTARLTDSIYLYGEYDYANSDKVRIPWRSMRALDRLGNGREHRMTEPLKFRRRIRSRFRSPTTDPRLHRGSNHRPNPDGWLAGSPVQ
jgi:hypothetical protein